jgi:hypothetical protein
MGRRAVAPLSLCAPTGGPRVRWRNGDEGESAGEGVLGLSDQPAHQVSEARDIRYTASALACG